MLSELIRLAPHLVLLLLGGLAVSWGMARWTRTEHARTHLGRLRWWGLAALALITLAGAVAVVYWMARGALEAGTPEGAIPHPVAFLGLGLLLGVPLSLPTVIGTWLDYRPAKVAERKREGEETTRSQRREYADKLLEQIQEASPEARDLSVSVEGEEGRILTFSGDLTGEEGERLGRALRRDLERMGFERVEGTRPGGSTWWTPV